MSTMMYGKIRKMTASLLLAFSLLFFQCFPAIASEPPESPAIFSVPLPSCKIDPALSPSPTAAVSSPLFLFVCSPNPHLISEHTFSDYFPISNICLSPLSTPIKKDPCIVQESFRSFRRDPQCLSFINHVCIFQTIGRHDPFDPFIISIKFSADIS